MGLRHCHSFAKPLKPCPGAQRWWFALDDGSFETWNVVLKLKWKQRCLPLLSRVWWWVALTDLTRLLELDSVDSAAALIFVQEFHERREPERLWSPAYDDFPISIPYSECISRLQLKYREQGRAIRHTIKWVLQQLRGCWVLRPTWCPSFAVGAEGVVVRRFLLIISTGWMVFGKQRTRMNRFNKLVLSWWLYPRK